MPLAKRLSLLSLLLSLGTFSRAAYEPAHFQKILFSRTCTQKQWSQMPDNSLEVILPPSADGPCEATLDFYSAENVRDFSALSFEARSLTPGAQVVLGLTESAGGDFAQSSPLPAEGLGTDWTPLRVRFSRVQAGWHPETITRLQFTAQGSTVFIRNIHFSAPSVPAVVPTVTAPLPESSVQRLPLWHLPAKSLGVLAIMGVLLGTLKKKRSQRSIRSPLYEINTRTWKSHRDNEGVIEMGGFKKITLSDLQEIKSSGFNAVWFMGIWEIGHKVRAISKRYGPDFMGSPFAISDYTVSTDLGTEQEFRDLVQRAHSVGLSVMVDFIPNHMGLDSLWLNDHPEYFIHTVLPDLEAAHSDEELEQRYPGYFPYRTPAYPVGDVRVPKTIMVAYGKDPYFYPWIDTAQLDYANASLRRKLIEILGYWAKIVDGVRCDMAMLVLREQVKIHRHPEMSWETFNKLMPQEFWPEAIHAVKRVNPQFTFVAETYWSMEGYLHQLGFDYTYNKPVYEAICSAVHSGNAEGLSNFLRMLGSDFLQKSVHFLENHDEERAMNSLGEERQRPAAGMLSTLPGLTLYHQGQLEGRRERLPVQRAVPLHNERTHSALHAFYKQLLKVTNTPVFREGRLNVLYSNNPALVTYARIHQDTKALVIVNTSNLHQKGIIFLAPGLRLHAGMPYVLHDLYYGLKSEELRKQPTVQASYHYKASQLINQGLYVELAPFDGHIFLIEPEGTYALSQRLKDLWQEGTTVWPLNRLPRKVLGLSLSRNSREPT